MASHAKVERCRLVLTLPQTLMMNFDIEVVRQALQAGDVASIIVPQFELGEQAYQKALDAIMGVAIDTEAAIMAVDDTQIAGRAGVDGIHITGSQPVLEEAMEKFGEQMMVGCGGVNSRHDALRRGETDPAYIYFGRFEKDLKPEPHVKNLEIATWWAQMVAIPCIVMGGNDVETIGQAAETGADFVALSHAVFGEGKDAAQMVARANALLEPYVFANA